MNNPSRNWNLSEMTTMTMSQVEQLSQGDLTATFNVRMLMGKLTEDEMRAA